MFCKVAGAEYRVALIQNNVIKTNFASLCEVSRGMAPVRVDARARPLVVRSAHGFHSAGASPERV